MDRPTPHTLASWLITWLARTQILDLAPSTRESYAGLTRRHLVPHLGDFLLDRLTRQDIRKAWLAMRAEGHGWGTIRNARIALSSCLAEAVEEGLLEHNPALGSTKRLWKGPLCPPKPILLMEECPRFLAAIRSLAPEIEDLFEVLLGTGMRIGEAIGLQLEDLDARGRLTIRRTCTKGRVGPVKGKRERTIALSPGLLERLRIRQAMLPGPWTFPSTRRPTKPWSYDYVARFMVRALAEAGIKSHVTPHGLRHGFSAFILEATGDLVYLQKTLGHSSISVTIDCYGQAARPERPDALAALDRAIHPPEPPRRGPAKIVPLRSVPRKP